MNRLRTLLLVVCCCSVDLAQQITGTVTGAVSDTSGAAVDSAQVQLSNGATGLIRTGTSDPEGNFRFLQLPAGTYAIRVSKTGFKAFQREAIVVEADRSLAVPVSLELGTVSEVVDVKGGADLLEPNTSSLGTTLNTRTVEDLPLNGRNPLGLANLVPTVQGIGYFGGQVLSAWRLQAVSIGGGPSLLNAYLVDGVVADKAIGGTLNFPTVEGTQELRVITNAMPAEFGRTGGGIISTVTKSGTNQYHGNAFEFLQNSALNANNFFSNAQNKPRPTSRWNQFGGTLGGPIKSNKLFFLATYEGYRQNSVNQLTTTSPTLLERAGDFSQTRTSTGTLISIYDPYSTRADPNNPGKFIRDALPGNRIPTARINPVGAALLADYPVPNQPGLPFTNAQNLFLQAPGPIDRNNVTGKVDWLPTAGSRLAFRYTWDSLHWQFPRYWDTPAVAYGVLVQIPRNSAALNYTNAISSTFLVEANVGFVRENERNRAPSDGYDITKLGFPQSLKQAGQVNDAATGRYVNVTVGDMCVGVSGCSYGGSGGNGDPALTESARVSATKFAGAHSLKAGFEWRWAAINYFGRNCAFGCYSFDRGFTQGPNPQVASATSGYGPASLLLGTPASATATLAQSATNSGRYWALFLQDDWKVTQKLTLNLGLRWEYERPWTDRYNVLSSFDPGVRSTVAGSTLVGGLIFPGVNGVERLAWNGHPNHFGPRFGFAYRTTSKLVLRGGIGVIYIPVFPQPAALPNTGFSTNTTMASSLNGGLTPNDTLTNPFPNGLVAPSGSSLGAATGIGTSIVGQLRDINPGYTVQWNFTAQYQPWNNWLVEAAWVGNHGVDLLGFDRNLNQISDANLALGSAALSSSVANPFKSIIGTGPLSAPTITRYQSLLPFPQYTGVNAGYSFSGNSIYHALTLKVEKRLSNGLSVLGAYTFSKLIDDGINLTQVRPGGATTTGLQDWGNLRLERSRSAQDVPQRLVISTVYDLPFGKTGNTFTRFLIGGWQVNGIATFQSGLPIALTYGGTDANRPNVVYGVSDKAENQTLNTWFNTAAFSIPAAYTRGNISRTLPDINSDGLVNLDFSVLKTMLVREPLSIQFRAEAFNLTNTPTFAAPGSTVGSALFGVVTATSFSPSPRQIQFGLKLMF